MDDERAERPREVPDYGLEDRAAVGGAPVNVVRGEVQSHAEVLEARAVREGESEAFKPPLCSSNQIDNSSNSQ